MIRWGVTSPRSERIGLVAVWQRPAFFHGVSCRWSPAKVRFQGINQLAWNIICW